MGSYLHADIVASVAGDNNEILTVTTGGMTADDYKGFVVYYSGTGRKATYIISSNTTNTITLETPTTAYRDLTSKNIQVRVPSDYFNLYEDDKFWEIEYMLNINSTYGQTTEITSKQLKLMLPIIEDQIHQYCGFTSPLTEDQLGYAVIRQVILSMLRRWNIVRQSNKTGNQMDSISTFIPILDREEQKMLNDIKPTTTSVCKVFDQIFTYGDEITFD